MTGTVVRLVGEKHFGFIKGKDGNEFFFHRDDFNGHWNDLRRDFKATKEPIPVYYDEEPNSKRGPRCKNVRRLDFPNMADGHT